MSPLAPTKKPVGRKKGMPALAIAAISGAQADGTVSSGSSTTLKFWLNGGP